MRATTIRQALGLAVIAVVLVGAQASANADIPKKVQAKFRGKILITEEPLPEHISDVAPAVRKYKALTKKVLVGEKVDGVTSWTFYYAAFLKKSPKVREMSLDFHTADKERLYVANKRLQLTGTLTVITGQITITEDDGPAAGKKYHLILRAKKGRKEIDVAKTTLTLK